MFISVRGYAIPIINHAASMSRSQLNVMGLNIEFYVRPITLLHWKDFHLALGEYLLQLDDVRYL